MALLIPLYMLLLPLSELVLRLPPRFLVLAILDDTADAADEKRCHHDAANDTEERNQWEVFQA